MARLNVNPTRMELSRLKARLKTSKRGHKLLKDKQDELMRQFIELIKENKVLREAVEKNLTDSLGGYLLARCSDMTEFIDEATLITSDEITLDMKTKNSMGVTVPEFEIKHNIKGNSKTAIPYGYGSTTVEFDNAIEDFNNVIYKLLDLAQVEKTCQLMADEIEKTRRRVNALEYRTIPQLEETITYIRMKLEENDRASITRLMKVKEMQVKALEEKQEENSQVAS